MIGAPPSRDMLNHNVNRVNKTFSAITIAISYVFLSLPFVFCCFFSHEEPPHCNHHIYSCTTHQLFFVQAAVKVDALAIHILIRNAKEISVHSLSFINLLSESLRGKQPVHCFCSILNLN